MLSYSVCTKYTDISLRISRIISSILHDLYSLRPPTPDERNKLISKHSNELQNWRRELSRFLDSDSFDVSLLIPIFGRQKNVLNLAYHHALILIYRPYLLDSFASLHNNEQRLDGAGQEMVSECLKAALSIITIVNELAADNQLYRSFWVRNIKALYS